MHSPSFNDKKRKREDFEVNTNVDLKSNSNSGLRKNSSKILIDSHINSTDKIMSTRERLLSFYNMKESPNVPPSTSSRSRTISSPLRGKSIDNLDMSSKSTISTSPLQNDVTTPLKPMTHSSTSNSVSNHMDSQYKYSSLSELSPTIDFINIYGIVVDYTTPKLKKGEYYTMTIYITDPTLPSNEQLPMVVNNTLLKMPQMGYIGQILRGHRLKCGTWNGTIQIQASVASSIVIIDPLPSIHGTYDLQTLIQQHSTSTWEDQDISYLNEYSKASFQSIRANLFPNRKFLKKLNELSSGSRYADIIAQVIGYSEQEDGLIVKVWDGTCYLDIGYYAEIFVTQPVISDYLRRFPLKMWVKFRNLGFMENRGLVTHHLSSISILPNFHAEVLEITTKYQTTVQSHIIENEDETLIPLLQNNQESDDVIITEHQYTHVDITPIEKLSTIPTNPAKFRILGRVVGFEPPSYQYFSQPFCSICHCSLHSNLYCPKCKQLIDRGDCTWDFRFKIIIQCPSSNVEVKVLVEKESAKQFLSIEPQCYYEFNLNRLSAFQKNSIARDIDSMKRLGIYEQRSEDHDVSNVRPVSSSNHHSKELTQTDTNQFNPLLLEDNRRKGFELLTQIIQYLQNPKHLVDLCVERYLSKTKRTIYRISDTKLHPLPRIASTLGECET